MEIKERATVTRPRNLTDEEIRAVLKTTGVASQDIAIMDYIVQISYVYEFVKTERSIYYTALLSGASAYKRAMA